MKSFREALPDGLLAQMQQELGQEETLRLLWPMVVGAELAANTRLLSIRQNRLRIAVPDQTWRRTLSAMERAILDAVHRVCGEEVGRAVDLVEDAHLTGPSGGNGGRAKNAKGSDRAEAGKSAVALRAEDLPNLPLQEIHDTELQQMFRQSAQKYFTRGNEAGQ
jgi:hypothetical protein